MSNFNSFQDDEDILMGNFNEYGTSRGIRPPENTLEKRVLEFRKQLDTISKGNVYDGILIDILKQYDGFFDLIHLES